MLKYYLWALTEKTASYVPFGRSAALTTCDFLSRYRGECPSFTSTFRAVRKVRELVPDGGKVLDFGTGWFHHDAFLIYLLGDYTTYLCDIEDRGDLRAIQNYLRTLTSHRDEVCAGLGISPEEFDRKIAPVRQLGSREAIYRHCHFVPCIAPHPERPFLPPDSIDFMVGSCVLNHIPPAVLATELRSLRSALKDDGRMCFLIGHEDHWAFHDSSVNKFNFYRYSDAYYRRFFETNFEYHNRMVKAEWYDLFREVPLTVEGYSSVATESTRSEIDRLPRIDPRFARYPREDLAAMYSYFLLAK